MGFPITIICTLQGTSVTQGNATVFTGNKFAVYGNETLHFFLVSRAASWQYNKTLKMADV